MNNRGRVLPQGSSPCRVNHAPRSRADCFGVTPRQPIVNQARSCEGCFSQGMFPKSVSGTSGKRRKNKGNDMAEDGVNDAILRETLKDVVRHVKNGCTLSFRAESAYGQSIIWASERIAELESQKQSTETGSDENRDENLSKSSLKISKSPLLESPDSNEEIHQRRRRERLLDELTLICVRDRIEQLIDTDGKQTEPGATTEQRWGRNSRETADQICRGINEYDAAH